MKQYKSIPSGNDYRSLVEYSLRRLSNRRRMETILKAYVTIGAGAAVIAVTTFLILRLEPTALDALFAEPMLLTAIGGLVLSLASLATLRVLVHSRSRFAERSEDRIAASFIEMWHDFEKEASTELEVRGANFDVHSMASIIGALVEHELIDDEDRSRLEWLLSVRNSLVHNSGTPTSDTTYALVMLWEMINRVASHRVASLRSA